MRLEPVYLLAPKPKPPAIPTRRAFLIASSTFFAGIGLGGACGYAAGVSGKGEAMADENALLQPAELELTGDANLDRLRWLATSAPLDELIESRLAFLNVLCTSYPTDKTSWRGIDRLVEAALGGKQIPNAPAFAQYLSQVIERGEPTVAKPRHKHIKPLRKIR